MSYSSDLVSGKYLFSHLNYKAGHIYIFETLLIININFLNEKIKTDMYLQLVPAPYNIKIT